MNILFVCTGNTCRSPMAEAILKHNYPQFNVKSAGIYVANNDFANPHTIEVLQKRNIKLDHRSQLITKELLDWADYVFVMTKAHQQLLNVQYPEYSDKYYPLKKFALHSEQTIETDLKKAHGKFDKKKRIFAKENNHLETDEYEQKLNEFLKPDLLTISELKEKSSNTDVSDPFGGSIHIYEQTYIELERLINQLVKIIK